MFTCGGVTIAACFVTGEGVVLGADSTTSTVAAANPAAPRQIVSHVDHAQKLFELGADSTIGVVTWGLASIEGTSIRTVLAEFDDDIRNNPPADFSALANRWASSFWTLYSQQPIVQQHKLLVNAGTLAGPIRQAAKVQLQAGFGLGGRWGTRAPQACEVTFDPEGTTPPSPSSIQIGDARFWGFPNIVSRLINGFDPDLGSLVQASGKWSGTNDELQALLRQKALPITPNLGVRDAIDVVHTLLSMTVRVIRFTGLPPICGGSIETAVITTDRPFRWVTHKPLNSALE